MRLSLTLAMIVVAAPLPTVAIDCANSDTRAELNTCAGQEYDRSDAELNRLYGTVLRRLDGDEEAQALLRRA
ncbi:lysozyme inhibitor LprI family protein [Chelativorans sp.]|uniref:lysozyme inhibitor LprI family protein n=1 Tax=Chelativorans sp. TaxID=2203393 RepID=UPI002810C9BB|nr:lysozyme inhibitor LprI family protein [Chelativorans sp.]